ncbi:MAG: carotenoid oxygenase family protein, partial [Halobacteria archaeon]|nr:carotenoid oxygenase family protein [Halobacteria archaeon]
IRYGERNGREYRYAYGVGNRDEGDFPNRLVKVDVKEHEASVWDEGGYPGEPVFVPSPEGEEEDDGVVLSVVLDPEAETSYLLVLDAVTFDEVARAETPNAVPFGFHGQFFGSV